MTPRKVEFDLLSNAVVLKPPREVQQHLVDIALLVQADPNLNKQIPDFLGLMRTVLDHLEKEPVTVEATDPRTKQTVKVTINKYVMQPDSFSYRDGCYRCLSPALPCRIER
jgi:hypothetical protein